MTFRIGVVTNRYPVDAEDVASPFVHDFCVALRDHGVDVRVLTPYYPTSRAERDPWVERFRWAESERVLGQLSPLRPADAMNILRSFYRGRKAALGWARAFEPHFILGLWAVPAGWWAMHAAKAVRAPFGIWCLGSDVQLWGRRPGVRGLIRRVLNGATQLYADGYALAEETTQLARRPCAFLPSLRKLRPSKTQAVDHPLTGQRYFLYMGRLTPEKGLIDLLRAAAELEAKADFQIALAGTRDPGFDLAAEVSRRKLSTICRVLGPQGPDGLAALARDAVAVVIPSHRDSIPLVLGEALQCGTPLICSGLPDLCRLLSRYRVGSVFPTGDAHALARAMQSFKPPTGLPAEITRFLTDFSPAVAVARLLADVRDDARPAHHDTPAHTSIESVACG